MAKYRKRPVVIEAEQYAGPAYVGDNDIPPKVPVGVGWQPREVAGPRGGSRVVLAPVIETLEGLMLVSPGDWVITGVKGERYPCKPDIFAATYEPAEPTPIEWCPACPHNLALHDADGSCGCGMDCANAAPIKEK